MADPQKHRDDSVTADMRPFLWIIIIAIGIASLALLLKRFGAF